MRFAREPRLHPLPITDLRPTQMTIGLREVAYKRAAWRAHGHKAEFLGSHLIPVILGPHERHYLIDHHHLARALFEEKVEDIAVTIVSDLSALKPSAFWTYLDNRSLTHLYDAQGKRHSHKKLPKSVAEMPDDPFRSLAGALRRAGGYAKDTEPFAEFLWADFLRRHIKRTQAESHPETALAEALTLSKSPSSAYLPGWSGPDAAA